jgi:hypothetical protein
MKPMLIESQLVINRVVVALLFPIEVKWTDRKDWFEMS